jgi:serine/threonine protein kinase
VLDLAFKEVILGDCCHHPNLAGILDIYVGDVPRLVFHWAVGSQLLQSAIVGLTLPKQVQLIRDIFSGLAHLHSHAIVHSNLHPSAIVVHPDTGRPGCGEVFAQILDLAGAAISGTVTESASGPLEYMAPEVLAGCTDPSTFADVWSAAAITAFVLTGRALFGQNPADHGQALINIFEVLGSMSSIEVDEFRSLPNWSSIYEVSQSASAWSDDLAGCPGADLLLRQMLIFGWSRYSHHHPPLVSPTKFPKARIESITQVPLWFQQKNKNIKPILSLIIHCFSTYV